MKHLNVATCTLFYTLANDFKKCNQSLCACSNGSILLMQAMEHWSIKYLFMILLPLQGSCDIIRSIQPRLKVRFAKIDFQLVNDFFFLFPSLKWLNLQVSQ